MVIFALKNQWHKNGIWWFSKILNRAVGEEFYDRMRIARRSVGMQVYYLRQQFLYRLYLEKPDVACMLGCFPKGDSSHGYGEPNSFEKYTDFQEFTINSDGSFGVWTIYISTIYIIHEFYTYFFPIYWYGYGGVKNCEEERFRLRDALQTAILEEGYGLQWLEWGHSPHSAAFARIKISEGLSCVDDLRAMTMAGIYRRNRYKEHYMDMGSDARKTRMVGV